MQVEKLWQFPIKEFHRMPRGILGPGAYEMVGVEAKKLGFKRSLLGTSGLRGTGIVEDVAGKIKYQGVDVVVYDKIESNPKDYNCYGDGRSLREGEVRQLHFGGWRQRHRRRQGRAHRRRPRRPQHQ